MDNESAEPCCDSPEYPSGETKSLSLYNLDTREDYDKQRQNLLTQYNNTEVINTHFNVNIVGTKILLANPARIYLGIQVFEPTEGAYATPWEKVYFPGLDLLDTFFIKPRDFREWCLPCHNSLVQGPWWVAAEKIFVCLRIVEVVLKG